MLAEEDWAGCSDAKGISARGDSLLKATWKWGNYPVAQDVPCGLPTLWELSEVFRHILMLHEPEVGSNYSGSVSLGTGLTSVLPGHGIIFIFRSDFQFGTVKHSLLCRGE